MSRVKLDSSKRIVSKLYQPGGPLRKYGQLVSDEAASLAKTNVGRGWEYQRSGVVTGYKRSRQTGSYAVGIRSSAGTSSSPKITLKATSENARFVEFGNGKRAIRRKRGVAKAAQLKKINDDIAALRDRAARNRENYARLGPRERRALEDRFQGAQAQIRSRIRVLEQARMAIPSPRIVLSTPDGIRSALSVQPMGRGKRYTQAEYLGYGTVNRAMRQAIKNVSERIS